MRRLLIGLVAVVSLIAGIVAFTPIVGSQTPDSHYLYVVSQRAPYKVRVYDMDRGHALVKEVAIPSLKGKIAGIAASAQTDRLYVTSTGGTSGRGYLLSYNLRNDSVVYTKTYTPGADGLCIQPNGRFIYMSAGEASKARYFFKLRASDGRVVAKSWVGAPQTHNAVCSTDNSRVYLSSIKSNFLTVVNPWNNSRVQRVGPFTDAIRPFAINGAGTLAIVNVNHHIGFEVGSMETGKMLYRVDVPGVSDNGSQWNPSHGVGMTPDEKEIWVADSQTKQMHIFDATPLPNRAPQYKTSIRTGNRAPYWINFSLDGRFAYPSSGQVLSIDTKKQVGSFYAGSSKVLQIDFQGNDAVRAGSRHGIGLEG